MTGPSNDLLVEVSPGETRVAAVDGQGRLVELEVERMGDEPAVGAIHLGRVVRVEKGMGAAFVDIGQPQPGFLGKMRDVTEGEAVIVQVLRPAGGGKGSVLTATPVLAGRYASLDALRPGIHWPRRWHGDKSDLQATLQAMVPDGLGVAPRPLAGAADSNALRAEIDRLAQVWEDVRGRAAAASAPAELLAAPRLIERVLCGATGRVVVDEPRTFSHMQAAAKRSMPDVVGRLELWRGDRPLFEETEIAVQIEAALAPEVALAGGANLVIDETEALTAIDVNMGAGGGRLPAEAAILRTNRAAATEIARQIRLRNIGGLIVIDFISMRSRGNRRAIVDAMRRAMRDDPVRHDVLGLTAAGLVEITRQRSGRPLAALFTCARRRSPDALPAAVACEALRAAIRDGGTGKPVLIADGEVIAVLQGPLRPALDETARRLGRPLELRAEAGRAGFEIVASARTDG